MNTTSPSPTSISLLALLALLGSTGAQAFTPGVSCYGGDSRSSCELRIASSLSLQTTVGHLVDNFDGSYHLSGTVTIVSGPARLPMQQADLVVNMGDKAELYGTAVIPFDRMSGLQHATFETLPRVTVGLVQGDHIEQLVNRPVPLNNGRGENGSQRSTDQPYILFHMDASLAMRYDFGEDYKMLSNFVFTLPGSVSATAVFDPADPYVYWRYDKTAGLDLNGLKKSEQDGVTLYDLRDDDGNLMIRYSQLDDGSLYEQNFVTGEMQSYLRNDDGDYVMQGGDADNPVILDGKQFDGRGGQRLGGEQQTDKQQDEEKHQQGGADIGAFGVSLHGWIPYKARSADGMPADVAAFSGQLLLSGSIPMGGGVNLDGDLVTYVGEHGYAQGGNGDVVWGLPFLPDFISFDIALGAASAALKVTDVEQMTFVSGELKPDTAFLQDLLPVMPEAGAKVQGYMDNRLNDAFVSIEGNMGLGASTFGDWIGIDLNDLAVTSARMKISADGFSVDGKTRMQIHPAIQISNQVDVHVAMSWSDPDDLVLRLVGNMDIYGVGLEDVTLEISARGMFVNGAYVTPLSRIAMSGEIGSGGAAITGSGSVTLNMGAITGAMRDAYDAMSTAQAKLDNINIAIEQMRDTIQAERDRDAKKLADAQHDVSAAQNYVNTLNSNIAHEYAAISQRKAQIRSWYRWYKKAKWYQKAYRYGRYAYQKGWRLADIGRHYASIGVYRASLVIANASLELAQWSLGRAELAARTVPIDADPRIVSLFTARESARLTLEAAKAPFAGIPYIQGDFAARMELTLDTSGIDGSVSASIDGYSLLQGSLTFAPQFKACLQIPQLGNACIAF